MKRAFSGMAIFGGLAALGIAYSVEVISRHGSDPAWPTHARYHLVVSAIHIIGMSLASLVLVWTSARKGSKPSWFALAILSLGAGIAWPVARWLTGEPTSRE